LESSPELGTGDCPRCGLRLRESYKYCPNCSYRLRPELIREAVPRPRATVTLGARLFALGGYLAFASILLLVVYLGLRLFARPQRGANLAPRLVAPRDSGCLPLKLTNFREVAGGDAYWGRADPAAQRLPVAYRVDDSYRLCIHEITNDQYFEFLLAYARRTNAPAPAWLLPARWTRHSGNQQVRRIYDRYGGDLPVTGISFAAAQEFCCWFWEERLGADPNLLADLPTAHEYVLAGRGDNYDFNYPWGPDLMTLDPRVNPGDEQRTVRVNIRGDRLRPVLDTRRDQEAGTKDNPVGCYGGFHALVGNAAEWVYGYGEGRPMAAGWSYLHWTERGASGGGPAPTRDAIPFSEDGFLFLPAGSPRPDTGFRILIRRAPSLPEFTPVSRGRVRYGPPPTGLLPPKVLNRELAFERTAPVSFEHPSDQVAHDFRIARTEITNRQYLAFLAATAGRRPVQETLRLTPASWTRANPSRRDAVFRFRGPFGPPNPDKNGAANLVRSLYAPGAENLPVEGVKLEQIRAYADWLSEEQHRTARLPTVAEFLRAGRGDSLSPYPWGADESNTWLICAGRPDDQGRAASLLGRFGDQARIYGLAGNLPEFVKRDASAGKEELSQEHYLLAGGCYKLPAHYCTLDTFFDSSWDYIDYRTAEDPSRIETLHDLAIYAGFRLVLVKELP